MSSLTPLTIPHQFRRRSPPTSIGMDDRMHSLAPYSSPPPSSSPPLAPLPLTRRNECAEWQTGDYFDDLCGVTYTQQHKVQDAAHPWSRCTRPEHPPSYMHRPLPSLMTKFATHALRSDAPLLYSTPPFSYVSQTAYFHPQGDGAIADPEEYDLESMDIHIRETYFATSAERGRWLSSPIAPRVRSQAAPPMRGHSSPVKSLVDASPLRERSRRRKISFPADKQNFSSPSQDRDGDMPCSSSLPPSSPLTSPISSPSFLSDGCEGDSLVDPCSNSDECHSLIGTPELSISSTTCTSPVEPTRTPSPRVAPATILAHQHTDISCHSAGSSISRHTSPKPIDLDAHALGTTDFEPDDILSPLSQFELELPEAEPLKLPLSDTVNKHYPEQHRNSPGATIHAVRRQDRSPPIHSLDREHLGASLDDGGGPSSNKTAKKRRTATTGNARASRSRKRAVIRSGGPSSDAKQRRGTERHASNHSEPPSKKSRLSHCEDGLESREAKSIPRRNRISKAKRPSRSPSRPTAESGDSESACLRDRKTPKPTGRARLQQSTPSPSMKPVSMDAVDVEFRASLTGMLVEALATSRATSMDASALYYVLTRAHPHLAERSKEELLMGIAMVLEAGRTRCGMFEKVDGSGETSHKALQSRWFYVPEKDEDPERGSLISVITPRQKRNETKKYKQYYYRPLDKMSRWDLEDAP